MPLGLLLKEGKFGYKIVKWLEFFEVGINAFHRENKHVYFLLKFVYTVRDRGDSLFYFLL